MNDFDQPSEWDQLAAKRFEQIASGRDITYSHFLLPTLSKHLAKGPHILDVGCGVGHGTAYLARFDGNILGIDPSHASIRQAKAGFPNLRFLTCRMEELVTNEQFTCMTLNMVLHNVPDPKEMLRSCRRYLPRGAQLIFSICHPRYWVPYKRDSIRYPFDYEEEREYQFPFTISLDRDAVHTTTYYHRTVESYLAIFAESGFSVDLIEAPFPSPDVASRYPAPWQYPRYLFGSLSAS